MSEEDRWSKWFNKKSPFSGEYFFGINAAIKEMEKAISKEFEELSIGAPENLQRERTLHDGTKVKSWGPFVYGYSVTVGPDGKPKVKEFGNFNTETRLGKPHMEVKEKREALADVIDSGEEIQVLVELPGVEKDDIKLSGTDDTLTILVESPQRKYFKEIELPAKVNSKKATSKYKNGVLDITIPKKKQQAKSETIKIE